ncbi:MAG: hypothetical protein MAG551_01714 [Candidatus Scalindua arabica]|uniref:Lipoprotein n=1 Tax=Candidatus Scalindua arabica TaxID=1127984 RepID=A0A941W3L4_9BACT|nr:hypothetical protein [Candidatus Scalindua arabica]
MKIMQSYTLRQSFFALILLFTICGCNTTNNTSAIKASDSNHKPDITQADSDVPKPAKPQSSPTEHHEEPVTDKKSGLDKKQAIETLAKRLDGFISGHGGRHEHTPEGRSTTSTKKSTENPAAKSEELENRLFIELEKKLYGSWINKKETESYEFHDDGTVLVTVIGKREKSFKLNGNYILVGEDRIKIDFRGDSFAGQMPPRYFKISISEDKFTLTDEPKGPGAPDGPSTNYYRMN